MGLCKGNVGNLLQHWVLCETIRALSLMDYKHLQLICTNSMAPWSIPETVDYSSKHSPRLHRRRAFDLARRRLSAQSDSIFMQEWFRLSPPGGIPYPSSACFVSSAWPHTLSLDLCEIDTHVIEEISAWLKLPEVAERQDNSKLHLGDWRRSLLSIEIAIGADVVLIESDPMQFEYRSPTTEAARNGGMLYPDDVERIANFCASIKVPTVIQLTSYDVNNGNSITITEPLIRQPLENSGFKLVGRVKPDDRMISLVFCRGLSLWQSTSTLDDNFKAWLLK